MNAQREIPFYSRLASLDASLYMNLWVNPFSFHQPVNVKSTLESLTMSGVNLALLPWLIWQFLWWNTRKILQKWFFLPKIRWKRFIWWPCTIWNWIAGLHAGPDGRIRCSGEKAIWTLWLWVHWSADHVRPLLPLPPLHPHRMGPDSSQSHRRNADCLGISPALWLWSQPHPGLKEAYCCAVHNFSKPAESEVFRMLPVFIENLLIFRLCTENTHLRVTVKSATGL